MSRGINIRKIAENLGATAEGIKMTENSRNMRTMLGNLIGAYDSCLTESEKGRAWALIWGSDATRIVDSFRVFLTGTYNLNNADGEQRYQALIAQVREHHPEWVSFFERNHQDKLARAARRVA